MQINSSNCSSNHYLCTLYFYGRNLGYFNAAACDQNCISGSWQCSPNGINCRTGIFFYVALRVIGKRYAFATKQVISSYLYILLLPCAFVVWIIRYGLGLDSSNLSLNRPPFTESPHLWAFACIVGALVAFFIILEVFEKTSLLSVREMEKALLDDQLREQSIYLAEAKKRDEQYRSFQHDINNHLLVLSGLI